MALDAESSIRRLNPPQIGSPPGYSQVVDVRANRIIFIAGQTALDRDSALVGKDDVAAQADQVLRNLGAARRAAACNTGRGITMVAWRK